MTEGHGFTEVRLASLDDNPGRVRRLSGWSRSTDAFDTLATAAPG